MTEASLPITQSAVETFTEQYLTSLGGSIEKDGKRWQVTIPEEADTELSTGPRTLICGDEGDISEESEQLHPGSSYFQDVLDEASTDAPVGRITIDSETTAIKIPPWLQESSLVVRDVEFIPYYDRTAVVTLFRVSVETVSEYQQEFLHAIAIDTHSTEVLPTLAETFLQQTEIGSSHLEANEITIEPDDIPQLIEESREQLLSKVQPTIDEIHEEASRAADAELEDYRQMQQEREETLEQQLSNLELRIDKLNRAITEDEQTERVETLKERKQYRSEYQEVEAELADLRQRREEGFPDRQREIRERHALEVITTPLSVTEVDYERGELEIEVIEGESSQMFTKGYGSGVGLTDAVRCELCDQPLSEQNPLESVLPQVVCKNCL